MAEIKKKHGFKYVTELPNNMRCVGIIEFKGGVLVATEKSVYKLKDNVLQPISFMIKGD